jgi:hypothetical protein
VVPFCSDTSETAALRCSKGAATRRGDTLLIGLSGVGAVHRADNLDGGEMYMRFQYFGRLGGGSGTPAFHVIDFAGYESGAVELINAATGDSLMLPGYPILSPDASRFVATAWNLETCEGVNQIDVWRITGDEPVREWTIEPYDCTRSDGWWPTDVAWRSADTIFFLRHTLPADSARRAHGESDTTRAMLIHRATGWALEAKPQERTARPLDRR